MHKALAVVAVAALSVSSVASATTAIPVSEPGVLELLAAGVVAGVIVWARKRRK